MARLFVIEAPGKARTLEAILQRLGVEARVQATKGHLYQMPKQLEPAGIDCVFREFERKPRDLTIIERLRREAEIAEDVVIATDADIEGDVIAWDVAETIRDLHPEPLRVRLKGMDDDSLREALAAGTPIRKEDAVAGRTRAIVDRLIGAGFSGGGVAVGRVGTALLGLVQRDRPTTFKLRLVAPAKDGGRPWTAEADLLPPLTEDIARQLLELDLPALDVRDRREFSTPPSHMGDIMVRASDRRDISPLDASKSMQRLYETGRLSYPRAGSRGISPLVALKMAAAMKKSGYTAVNKDNFAAKSDAGVHDAPYPIGKIDLDLDPRKLDQDEGIRAMISRDLVKAGQIHVEERPLMVNLEAYLKGKGFSLQVANAVANMPWRRESGPRYPGRQEAWADADLIKRRPDAVLLEKAVAAGLGRPSTWANHIEVFMTRGLVNDDLKLTAKGRAWLEASPKELLDPRVSAAIEAACEKCPPSFLAHPEREPWELNAERIVRALPPQLRNVVEDLVAHEPPRPKIDPVEAYGLSKDFVAEAEARVSRPAYTMRERLAD